MINQRRLDVLVTGGRGFIGKNLLEQLPQDYNLIAPSHSELDLLDWSAVESFFKKNKIDVVVHCSNIG